MVRRWLAFLLLGAGGQDPQPLTGDGQAPRDGAAGQGGSQDASSGAPAERAGQAYRDEAPRWTADGEHVLFIRYDAGGNASLWYVGVRDRQPVRVAGLGPAPGAGPAEWWFGYYGYVGAGALYSYTPRG